MSRISLDKDLVPGDEVTFRLDVTLFGELVDDTFDIIVPKAPKLMSKEKEITVSAENKVEYDTGNNKSINFTGYVITDNNLSETKKKLALKLNSNKVPGSFSTGDDVVITSGITKLNNLSGTVVTGNNGRARKNYLYLSVNGGTFSDFEKNLTATGTVTEVKKIIKKRKITVKLPDGFTKTLITKKSPGAPSKGNVEDIPIFAYKQFNGVNRSSIKYKLMNNNDVVNLKTPPNHGDIVEWRGVKSESKSFTLNDENGNKLLCYVAIARYTYNGSKWQGEWLQVSESGNVIWGQAR